MKYQILLLTVFIFPIILVAQNPITIAEGRFKIAGVGEESFYFGLCAGDELILNFEELKGKKMKAIEIVEQNGMRRFMDFKTSHIAGQTVKVNATGIYEIRFKNGSVRKRIGQYHLARIPATDSLRKFNTSVYTKTVHDTTYRIKQERYLISKTLKPVAIIEANEHYINGGARGMVGGKSRVVLPINLPRNTVEWYYKFSSYREKKGLNQVKNIMNLFGELSLAIDQTGALGFGIELLSQPTGGATCDLYLLDQYERANFSAKNSFSYLLSGSRENFKSGVVKMNGGLSGYHYLGIKNPATLFGIHVALEVVAITLEENWGIREIQIPKITSRKVQYLKP